MLDHVTISVGTCILAEIYGLQHKCYHREFNILFIKLASWEFVMLHNVLVMNWPTGKLAW
jgi:hypothetical protein